MIWIWLAYRNSVNWNTGPLDRYFTYVCHHCAAQLAAMVPSPRRYGRGSETPYLQKRKQIILSRMNSAAVP